MELMLGNQDKVYDVIIIGAGPAGASAAIYTARAGLSTLVLYRAEADGALGVTQKIENYPGIRGPLTGFELLKLMRDHAKAFGAEFQRGKVIATSLEDEIKSVYTIEGKEYKGRAIIVSSGAMERVHKFPGEEEFLGKGVSYCGVCDAAFFKDRLVAVVGDDDYGLEEAEFIARFASKVYFVVPSSKIRAPQEEIEHFLSLPNVEILLHTRPVKIVGDSLVKGLHVKKLSAGEETTLEVDGVFIFIGGNKPSVDFLMGQVKMNEHGCLEINEEMMTSVPGVFAAGDILCTNIKQAVIAAADGVKAALAVDKYLNKKSKITSQW
ncbi:thioredoxin reductase [Hydrogenobaculum sp. Y04AAS1]|uniref:thioredoxin-disulfide reductase n=1 Tax=Hydrogenobaculum sp. (strain Y04AAS1) TaxID=380749 RepID=UPI00015BD3DA|nr:thioredoxin reductase [Hydrogenobaculum sp. Y04AAS1]HCT66976.1 thioredoxin-disulfide reductase [Hydrogenobaculum sp.]